MMFPEKQVDGAFCHEALVGGVVDLLAAKVPDVEGERVLLDQTRPERPVGEINADCRQVTNVLTTKTGKQVSTSLKTIKGQELCHTHALGL